MRRRVVARLSLTPSTRQKESVQASTLIARLCRGARFC
jgi:hypothetical protein